jgi:hypothetical protein
MENRKIPFPNQLWGHVKAVTGEKIIQGNHLEKIK